MAMSGITVDDECMEQHTLIKKKHELRYIMFKIADKEGKIVVEKSCRKEHAGSWEDFCVDFPDDDCRYALFDLPVRATDDFNQETDKLLMISWIGPQASIKKRMMSSSSLSTLKTKLNPDAFVQCDDRRELLDVAAMVRDNKQLCKFQFNADKLKPQMEQQAQE